MLTYVAPIEIDPVFGCRLWTGPTDADGYPLTDDGRRAHRVAYEEGVAAIPAEHELDHTCRRRRCVFVRHLEPVDRSSNEKRKAWRARVRIVRCPAGHALSSLTAMITPEGGRVCRQCAREGATS